MTLLHKDLEGRLDEILDDPAIKTRKQAIAALTHLIEAYVGAELLDEVKDTLEIVEYGMDYQEIRSYLYDRIEELQQLKPEEIK